MRRLILPFFLIGWFGPHGETLLRDANARDLGLIATVLTALVAALVGWHLGRRHPGKWGLGSPLLGGAVNGAILATLFLEDPNAAVAGALFGLFYAFLYLIPMWVLCYAHFEIDDRRALWWGTQLILVIMAAVCGLTRAPSTALAGPGAAVAVASIVGLTGLLLEVRARRHRRHRRPEPLALGPYRQAPVTPVDDNAERALLPSFLFNGLLLVTSAMIWACSGWLLSPP